MANLLASQGEIGGQDFFAHFCRVGGSNLLADAAALACDEETAGRETTVTGPSAAAAAAAAAATAAMGGGGEPGTFQSLALLDRMEAEAAQAVGGDMFRSLAPPFCFSLHSTLRQRACDCLANAAAAASANALSPDLACMLWRTLRHASAKSAVAISRAAERLGVARAELHSRRRQHEQASSVPSLEDGESLAQCDDLELRLRGEASAAAACASALWALVREVPQVPLLSQLSLSATTSSLAYPPSAAAAAAAGGGASIASTTEERAYHSLAALDFAMARVTCTAMCAAQLRPLVRLERALGAATAVSTDHDARDYCTDARCSVAGAMGSACLGASSTAEAVATATATATGGAAAAGLPSDACVAFAGSFLCRRVADERAPVALRADSLFALFELYGQDWNARVRVEAGPELEVAAAMTTTTTATTTTTLGVLLQRCAAGFVSAVQKALEGGGGMVDEERAERIGAARDNLGPFMGYLVEMEGAAA